MLLASVDPKANYIQYGSPCLSDGTSPSFSRIMIALLVTGVAGAIIFGVSGSGAFDSERPARRRR